MNMQLLKMALSLLEHTWMNHKDPVHVCAFDLTLWSLNRKEKNLSETNVNEKNIIYFKLYVEKVFYPLK